MPLFAVVFLAAALLTLGLGQFELRHWRKSAGAHWTERARQLYPARVFRSGSALFTTAFVTLAARAAVPSAAWPWLAVAGYAGSLLGYYPLDRVLVPGTGFRHWLHGLAVSQLIHVIGWGTLFLGLALMPLHWNAWMLVVLAGYIAVKIWIAFGGNLRLLRLLRLLRPAPPAVDAMARSACAAAGVPVRAIWELRVLSANALAFTATCELAYTTTLLAEAPMDELHAVTEHEISHLQESRAMLAGRLASDLVTLPLLFWFPALHAFGPRSPICLLAAVAILYVGRRQLVRRLEHRADRGAVRQLGDGLTYARALERLYRLNQMPAVGKRSLLASHPHLYDRMVAAGVTPDYPRPAPPDKEARSLSFLSGLTSAWVVFTIMP